MPGSMEHPRLHFEGDNDLHVIKHLLTKHNIDLFTKPLPSGHPECRIDKTVEELLSGMEIAIGAGRLSSVGFVLDADSPLMSRWNEVRSRLRNAQVEGVPDLPTPGGFIGWTERFKVRVGVWLMPDNQQDGKIEDFLRLLIDEQDSLIVHAQSATDEARQRGAKFKDTDWIKAVIHTWLAWQEAPGSPFGRAVSKHFFRHDRPVAQTFVTWFRQLYNIPLSVG